jgi:hypothetical protein
MSHVDAQLRLQFLGRDVMLPSVMASDPAHDPNTFPQPQPHWQPNLEPEPVEALKKPHVLSTYNPAFRAIQKQREQERLVGNLLRLKRNAPRPENLLLNTSSLLQLRDSE